MTNRKKLNARQKAAKRRRAAKQLENLKLDLRSAQLAATVAGNALDDMHRLLAGKVIVVLDYSVSRAPIDVRHESSTHRLEACAATWSGNRLCIATDVRLCSDIRVDDASMRLAQDVQGMLRTVRRRLGSDIGAELMENMRPRRD